MTNKSTIAQKTQNAHTSLDVSADLGVRRIELCESKEADRALDSYELLMDVCAVGNELGTFLRTFAQ